jgi:hypothetical protein
MCVQMCECMMFHSMFCNWYPSVSFSLLVLSLVMWWWGMMVTWTCDSLSLSLFLSVSRSVRKTINCVIRLIEFRCLFFSPITPFHSLSLYLSLSHSLFSLLSLSLSLCALMAKEFVSYFAEKCLLLWCIPLLHTLAEVYSKAVDHVLVDLHIVI